MAWYRNDKAAVVEALRRGERPDLATTMASGPLDELVTLHEELGIFAILDELEVQRERAGVSDELLLRTLATLPFVEAASVGEARSCSANQRCCCNWAGHPCISVKGAIDDIAIPSDGKKSPCLVILIRCAMPCVGWRSRLGCRRKQPGSRPSTSDNWCVARSMPLMAAGWAMTFAWWPWCVSATRPIIVAWRLLSGPASEKGQEAAVTRSLIEQVVEVAGPQAISLLLADALYADGPLLAWLKYRKGIDALVSLPEDRLLYQDLQGLAAGQLIDWTHHRYLRTIGGHKQVREVEVTAAGELTSWDGFTEKAAHYGVPDACLWACLIHDVSTEETAAEAPRALVSTRSFADGFAALQAFRPRWHIEDDTYRELKEGWGLEQQRWGRDFAAALGRTRFPCLAFNTAQVYRLQAGERLASMAIRRLRRQRQRELGSAPAVLYVAGCYGVFSLEELLEVLGSAPRESLLPTLAMPSSPDSPT